MKNQNNFGWHNFLMTFLICPGASLLCILSGSRGRPAPQRAHRKSHFADFWLTFPQEIMRGNYFHQKSSVCFLAALTFAASHATFYQKVLITTKVSFEKQVFHESRSHGKSATQFRLCSLITACNTLPPSAPPCPAGLVLVFSLLCS